MISSGTVSSDLNNLQSVFDKYNSIINELSSVWSGPSYDNLISCADDFSSSYLSTIKGEMEAFLSACDLYNQYLTAKKNLSNSEDNYKEAVRANDSSAINKYNNDISQYQNEVNDLKSHITSYLETASSTKLDYSNFSDIVHNTYSSSYLENGKNFWQPQGNGDNCGITALMVAVNTILGENVYTDNVGEWNDLDCATETMGWTSGDNMAKRWIHSHGLDDKIEVTGVENIHSREELQEHLRNGEVVVASSSGKVFKLADGSTVDRNHYITFYAIDEEGNCYANDSARSDSSNYSGIKYTPEDLDRFYGKGCTNGSVTLQAV